MSFSSLVSDLAFRDIDAKDGSQFSRSRSYASTAATSVSIAGDISSQLHGGYSHPLARLWQAERQLTKVLGCNQENVLAKIGMTANLAAVDAHLPALHLRPGG